MSHSLTSKESNNLSTFYLPFLSQLALFWCTLYSWIMLWSSLAYELGTSLTSYENFHLYPGSQITSFLSFCNRRSPSKFSDSAHFRGSTSSFIHLCLFLPGSVRSQREASHLSTLCLLISLVTYTCSYSSSSTSHKAMTTNTIRSSYWSLHNQFSSSSSTVLIISVSDLNNINDLNNWNVFHRTLEDEVWDSVKKKSCVCFW